MSSYLSSKQKNPFTQTKAHQTNGEPNTAAQLKQLEANINNGSTQLFTNEEEGLQMKSSQQQSNGTIKSKSASGSAQFKGNDDFTPDHSIDAGGTAAQEKEIKTAVEDAYKMVDKAQIYLGGTNRQRYKTWFDSNYTSGDKAEEKRYDGLAWNFIKLHSVLKSKEVEFAYDSSKKGVYAYVDPNDGAYKISLGPAFWNAPATGRDSKAGTIVHELSHEECGTDDHVYGEVGAKDLALNDPAKAVNNADNYEYFAEDSL
jgi:peptidyl-Lys metalloendopeptidase